MSEEKSQKLTEQTDRGLKATATLVALGDAFEALEADCFDTFRNSDVHDDEGRKTCRIYLKVLDDVKARFVSAVITGDAARKELVNIAATQSQKL